MCLCMDCLVLSFVMGWFPAFSPFFLSLFPSLCTETGFPASPPFPSFPLILTHSHALGASAARANHLRALGSLAHRQPAQFPGRRDLPNRVLRQGHPDSLPQEGRPQHSASVQTQAANRDGGSSCERERSDRHQSDRERRQCHCCRAWKESSNLVRGVGCGDEERI